MITRLCLLAISALLFTSVSVGCSFTSAANTELDVATTNVNLSGNNFRVIMTNVSGSSTGFQVFQIFGARASYASALTQIREQAQIKDRSRALVNVTQDWTAWNAGIVNGDSVKVTADVVEFVGGSGGE